MWFNMFDLPWDKTPDYVNEIGVKWWLDKDTTDYANKKNINNKKLNARCWFIEDTDKRRTRVLVCSDTNNILYESQSLESMLHTIDFLKFVK